MPTQVTRSYADIYAWENLYDAYRKASRGKRGRSPAAAFEFYLEDNLIWLQDVLAAETYRPGRYVSFVIHEPKRRLISAAPFVDRVVHHALCNIIESAFERSFIAHSYANRVGKGTHRALDTCQRWMVRYPYVLQCDLKHFLSKYRPRVAALRSLSTHSGWHNPSPDRPHSTQRHRRT